MFSFLRRYRDAMRLQHGWPLALRCPDCAHHGVPEYRGWTPNRSIRLGKKPLVFADVFCAGCGSDLKPAAEGELVRRFADIPIRKRNKRIIALFLLAVVGLPVLGLLVLSLGMHEGWWGSTAFTALTLAPIVVVPAILIFNYRLAVLRKRCECGKPDFVFLGLLGGSYCLRCGSCGFEMRMRD